MAGLFDKQADLYLDARPNYPSSWYSLLSDRTTLHSLAWDVGTGNGQAALALADHYSHVIATDISQAQLSRAPPHPKVKYLYTPLSLTENELVTLIGPDNSVDLITVAQAVHWFDLPRFYSTVTRLLRKPGGVFAVWGYNDIVVSDEFDVVMKKFHDTTLPFWDKKIEYLFDGYKTLPFPFEDVRLGCEGMPKAMEIPKRLSFGWFLGMVKSWSAVVTAAERGVDLVPEEVVKEFERAWGGPDLVRDVVYKAFLLAGKVKM